MIVLEFIWNALAVLGLVSVATLLWVMWENFK
jgi:hypothetical protein